ncbi:MAG TPA: ferritin [Candidatus Paceibacterota bacterium]|nr:ferritin [Candidatus Paceibacterota bacterium]
MLHEKREQLSEYTQDMKRAVDSLREELEAMDWYLQRADATEDANLKKILLHNRKEESEHAAMLLEWIRQHDEDFDQHLHEYLFSDAEDIAASEENKDDEDK